MAFSHAKNSHFQYAYFIAGKAHTADEAYRLLKNELEDRVLAIRLYEAELLRKAAERRRAEDALAGDDPISQLEVEAKLAEMDAREPRERACYAGALAEKDFLEELLTVVEPHRKYRLLSDAEAFQACQREEWLLEFMERIENFYFTCGTMPADQLAAMRGHPDFHGVLFPYMTEIRQNLNSGLLPPRAWTKAPWRMALEGLTQDAPALPHPCGCKELPETAGEETYVSS